MKEKAKVSLNYHTYNIGRGQTGTSKTIQIDDPNHIRNYISLTIPQTKMLIEDLQEKIKEAEK